MEKFEEEILKSHAMRKVAIFKSFGELEAVKDKITPEVTKEEKTETDKKD